MSLRLLSESDLQGILEDKATGFGWDVTIKTPGGVSESLVGFSNDISQMIDPDTGQAVSGRLATVVLRISSIYAALPGVGLPEGISDPTLDPWTVTFDDINGLPYTFKITSADPDRTLGIIPCILETYIP